MRFRSLAPALAVAAIALTGCSSSGSSTAAPAAPSASTAASAPASDASAAQPASPGSAAPGDSTAPAKPAPPSDAGLPPKPDAPGVAKLVAALDAIDPDIVAGQPDKAVDRARNQCQSIYDFPKDRAKLIDLTNQRFTSPKHPDGFGADKAEKILTALQTTICPSGSSR
ncbi:hypothetical protein [Saccharothrix sp. ST-888]|uniref:hypothetical protein n=1 Tax=Saccharothrix sp. ST-888 TaxID=1427391 RepID=UPI00069670D7|nr:hypothetical protein [Saccharothrix sp. ST-888]